MSADAESTPQTQTGVVHAGGTSRLPKAGPNEQLLLLTGNHAVAYGAMRARPQVVPIYPITPQTPIAEKISDLQLSGEFNVDLMTVESEHSAMSACITASLTGARVFTATASQGLLLMHEMLHFAAGARTPIVMVNVNRTVASPWGFWPDQTDSLSQRDTGWVQYYTENGQESLDTVIQAFKVAEQVGLPTMVVHEAFYISHSMEPVIVPAQDVVDQYLPPFDPEERLDWEQGRSWGNPVNQELYYRHRKDMDDTLRKVPEAAVQADMEYEKAFGRGYGIVERYRMEDAEIGVVAFGSMCGTAREAIDEERAAGRRVGLVKVKLFRPFPINAVREAVAGVPRLAVIERNYMPGVGGCLHQELKAALFGVTNPPLVHGYLAGVGGVSVPVRKIREILDLAQVDDPIAESVWQR